MTCFEGATCCCCLAGPSSDDEAIRQTNEASVKSYEQGDANLQCMFAPNGQAAQEFGGTSIIKENVLLGPEDGLSLSAEPNSFGEEKFNFRLFDTGIEHPRLDLGG